MLRITVSKRKDHLLFVLEGRLTGKWAEELLRITRKLHPGTNSVFDLEDVLFVDQEGEKVLQQLSRLGATFAVRNAYGVDLCGRLHLHHATEESAAQGREGKRRGDTASIRQSSAH